MGTFPSGVSCSGRFSDQHYNMRFAVLPEKGGPKMWGEFMDELRALHLGKRAKRAPRKRA
jgi:hypothetical protein